MEMKTFIKSTIMIAALSTIVLTGCDKEDLPKIRTEISADNDIYGVVEDTDGNRLAGVTVSDGYNCSVTDQNGVYQLKRGEFSYQVFVSVPSDCKIPSRKASHISGNNSLRARNAMTSHWRNFRQ